MPRGPTIVTVTDHLILLAGVFFMIGPLGFLVWQLVAGIALADLRYIFVRLWVDGPGGAAPGAARMMWNSLVLALGLVAVKGMASLLAAYALVFFRVPCNRLIYFAVLLALFFPIESRILPTFDVTADLGLLNSYAGMILPVAASGLGVLIFGQYLRQIPPELVEAARIDGAGPMRMFADIIVPLSMPMIAALFAILFVLGWNQYLWPLMVSTTGQEHDTLVRGMATAGLGGRTGLALALLALVPPAIVVVVLQRWMMRGLTTGIH